MKSRTEQFCYKIVIDLTSSSCPLNFWGFSSAVLCRIFWFLHKPDITSWTVDRQNVYYAEGWGVTPLSGCFPSVHPRENEYLAWNIGLTVTRTKMITLHCYAAAPWVISIYVFVFILRKIYRFMQCLFDCVNNPAPFAFIPILGICWHGCRKSNVPCRACSHWL